MNKELLDYFNNDELAANVWLSKYAQEEETSPDQMHKRLAKEFARIEESYQKEELKNDSKNYKLLSKYGQERVALFEPSIYELFKDFKYIIPQGSIMATLGTNTIASLSNCWVAASPLDSYGGILKTDGDLAYYYKRRGGVGTDLSNIRPKGTKTNNSAKSTTGVVSFMHRFSNTTREVAMEGRRGALMLSLDVNHPDIMDFIKVKRDGVSVTGANISIKLNNEFMKAVENDERYVLRFPCDFYEKNETWIDSLEKGKNDAELNVLQPIISGNDTIGYTKVIKAKEYWNEIIKSAKNYAEPGLMYWDNMLNYDPATVYPQFKPTCSNPCGEQFLNPNDSCRLMVLNLFSFVENPFAITAKINYKKLYEIAYEHARLGDDLVDLELEYIQRIIDKIKSDPEPIEIKRNELELWEKSYDNTKAGRRVGLGITALADMLAALNLKYDSEEALEIIDKVMSVKMEAELDCTIDLSILRGSFDGWNAHLEYTEQEFGYGGGNKFYEFLYRNFSIQFKKMQKFGRRSVSWSTIAPTGSVSILTQTSSGCEPLFSPYYFRRKKINPSDKDSRVDFTDQNGDKWQEFPVLHPKFLDWYIIAARCEHCPEIAIKALEEANKEMLQKVFEESPYYKSTANDIDWIKRNEIQAILQKYTTNAISSTINLPSTVTEQEVSDIYMSGWKLGLKGQTVYVDGSRSGVLITESTKDKPTFEYKDAVKRPRELDADVHHVTIKGVAYKILVGLLDNKPYEVFFDESENKISGRGIIFKKKRGNYFFKKDDITTDITSAMSDEQVAISRLVSTSLRHGASIHFITEQLLKCDGDIFSFTKSLARVLKKYIPEGVKSTVTCNDCGSSNVIFQEGCQTCQDCGNSRCG